jgi:hypothetical protein
VTYERLGHELPDDLVLACGICHDMIHVLEHRTHDLRASTEAVKAMRSGPTRQPKPSWALTRYPRPGKPHISHKRTINRNAAMVAAR